MFAHIAASAYMIMVAVVMVAKVYFFSSTTSAAQTLNASLPLFRDGLLCLF
ncbi:MAG: hypothetical protein ACJARW_001764 [Methylophilaceae bacterium]